jgi:hypothetical protein
MTDPLPGQMDLPLKPPPEPPSLDIYDYEGREPSVGKGVPQVAGTPDYAPEAEKPRRRRKGDPKQ